jgi:tRNA-modifying protein YgfZ
MRVHLDDRGVIRVTGDDAVPWLQNIVTCDIARLEPGGSRWGALLTPQGKILFDFVVTRTAPDAETAGALYLDVPLERTADLAKRLRFYRLRAKVAIEDLTAAEMPVEEDLPAEEGLPAEEDLPAQEDLPEDEGGQGRVAVVAASPGEVAAEPGAVVYPDPRHPGLGSRAIMSERDAAGASDGDLADYHARRIALGIPEGGLDFAYGDTFPHEALMDLLGAVDFRKGCYVGQEVVSRMQHRGTARSRIVPVTIEGPAPDAGTEVVAGGKSLGTMGSSSLGRGLALLRLDRVEDALAAGSPMIAAGATLKLAPRPDWWPAPWPGERAVSGS